MTRLAISVEGATERVFVNRTLAPYLAAHGVLATPIQLMGPPNLARIASEIRRLLPSFEWVTTFYDYYGFQRRGELGPDELQAAIAAVAPESQRGRIVPYIQLHEFEALVFSDPKTAAAMLSAPGLEQGMARILGECGEPERIDDGYDTCPSRRLAALYPRWDKTLHGPQVVDAIGIETLCRRCARFGSWVARLGSLGAIPL